MRAFKIVLVGVLIFLAFLLAVYVVRLSTRRAYYIEYVLSSPDNEYQVMVQRANGLNPKLVVKNKLGNSLIVFEHPVILNNFAWSPDSKYLAFVASNGESSSEGDGYVVHVFLISIESGQWVPIISDPECSTDMPSWLNDREFLFSSICNGIQREFKTTITAVSPLGS